jgi:hypothetical protein
MKYILVLATFLLSACSVNTSNFPINTSNKTFAEPMVFAEDFFVDEVKSCGASNVNQENLDFIQGLIGIQPDQLYNSNSLTVKWNYIGDRVLRTLDMSYTVASEKNNDDAQKILAIIEKAADTQLFYDWENWNDVAGKSCWRGPDGKCAYHHPEFATQFITGMLISAIVLEEYITPAQKEKFNTYFDKMYKRFIAPQAFNNWSTGFYAGANGGIGNLAYARWTRDTWLFNKEITYRKHIIKKHFKSDGWIENNSWRGNRDYWYHTLGLDTVLGYMIIARSNGIDLFNDKQISSRISASIDKTVLGNQSLEKFSEKGYKGKNHITGSKDARPHMHQEATNLVQIVNNEYGVSIQPRNDHFRRQNGQENVNVHVGFNASCYYSSK